MSFKDAKVITEDSVKRSVKMSLECDCACEAYDDCACAQV